MPAATLMFAMPRPPLQNYLELRNELQLQLQLLQARPTLCLLVLSTYLTIYVTPSSEVTLLNTFAHTRQPNQA